MPFSIRVDKLKELVVSTFTGRLTASDIIEGRRTLSENRDFRPDFSHILDFRAVTEVDLTRTAIQHLSAESSLFEKTAVQVIVAPQKLKFDLAKMFQTYSGQERPSLHVTRSLEAAYALIAVHKTDTPT